MQFKQIPLTDYEQKLHNKALRTARVYQSSKREAVLLVIVEEVDRLKLYEKFSVTSTYKYCRTILNLTEKVSYAFQAVARKTRKVPQLMQAVKDGLSILSASKIISQLTVENCAMWFEKAKALSQHDLELALRLADPKRRRATKKEPIDRTHSRMAIDISNSTLAKLIRAQELIGGTEADVLDAALEVLLEKKDPVRKADRAMKKYAAEKSEPNSAESYSQEEPVFTPAKFGVRVPFNARTYHAVNERDRGQCQAILPNGEKCCSTRWVEIHHLLEVAKGGTNDISNLTTLCSAHHRIYHQHGSRVWSPTVAYVA